MSNHLQYEEERPAGEASHACLVSVAKTSPVYRATKDVLGWEPSPSGEAARAAIPIIELEELVRSAPVADDWSTWTAAMGYGVVTTCVHVDFLQQVFDFAEGNAVLTNSAGSIITFDSKEEAWAAFDTMFEEHPDEPTLTADATAWDDLEPLTAGAAVAAFQWLEDIPIMRLVMNTRNLRAYVELSRIMGPRGVDLDRTDQAEQLWFACANDATSNGGQLGAAMQAFFKTPRAAGSGLGLLSTKVADFLTATTWEFPLAGPLPSYQDYALELPARA
ncbi:MAG: hypothetical protein ACPIOQ_57515, partial [Promethearchaeia archaeon]